MIQIEIIDPIKKKIADLQELNKLLDDFLSKHKQEVDKK